MNEDFEFDDELDGDDEIGSELADDVSADAGQLDSDEEFYKQAAQ